jgi:hypothetical protein
MAEVGRYFVAADRTDRLIWVCCQELISNELMSLGHW